MKILGNLEYGTKWWVIKWCTKFEINWRIETIIFSFFPLDASRHLIASNSNCFKIDRRYWSLFKKKKERKVVLLHDWIVKIIRYTREVGSMQSNYSLHCDNCFQQTKYGGSTFSTKVEVVRSIIVVHDFYKVQTVINFTLIRSNIWI